MKFKWFIWMFFLLLIFASCEQGTPSSLEVNMYNASGDMVGKATLTDGKNEVTIKLKVEGFSPGFHGIHIHEYAKCDAPDFKTAGNHFNPEGKKHGLMHPEGTHIGDLPNVEADSSGIIDTEITVSDATLKEGKKSLLTGEGTALIITEDQDDGMTQPSGESGKRLVCGKITKQKDDASNEEPTDPTEIQSETEEE